ncbi:MAG: hypothetical protein K0S85_1327, partial [Pseudomonas orientalis]|nr:hypothetical protein [Pseudomonas orientalis]
MKIHGHEAKPFGYAACSEMPQQNSRALPDCKSVYAGSIPTSASIIRKSPADENLRGFFMW